MSLRNVVLEKKSSPFLFLTYKTNHHCSVAFISSWDFSPYMRGDFYPGVALLERACRNTEGDRGKLVSG